MAFVLISPKWLLLTLLFISQICYAETADSLIENISKPKKIKTKSFNYFRIGLDLSKLLASSVQNNYHTFEAQVDATFRKNLNLATEFGYAKSMVKSEVLSFSSNNIFMTIGADKSFLNKEFEGDYDNAFVGLRYGMSLVNRSEASYVIFDDVWGNATGIIPQQNFYTHWFELNAGFKMEIIKNVFTGWNIRFRALINPDKFEELPPAYLAGYGRADKNSAMGYNFYILYGIGKR